MQGILRSLRVASRDSAIRAILLPLSRIMQRSSAPTRKRAGSLAVSCALLFPILSPAIATDLAKPTGDILLTVSGNITNQNHADGVVFDLQMLEAMPVTTFVTETPWTTGPTKFSGVRLNHLLKIAGANSRQMKMIAEDGYIYELDIEIEDKYPVIIAYKQNDEYMSLRKLGPLWVMFPFDDFPELNTETYRAASVWQLNHLEMK